MMLPPTTVGETHDYMATITAKTNVTHSSRSMSILDEDRPGVYHKYNSRLLHK